MDEYIEDVKNTAENNEAVVENKSFANPQENEPVTVDSSVSEDEVVAGEPAPVFGDEPVQKEEPTPVKKLEDEDVLEHTASLWNYFPVPTDQVEPVPEYITLTKTFPGSKITAARVRGKKHKHEGTNCDDWFEVSNYDDITFIVVSDGAGSKKFSRIGARESCRAAAGYLAANFKEAISNDASIRENLKLEVTDAKFTASCSLLAEILQKASLQAFNAVEAAFYSRSTNEEYSKLLGRDLRFNDLSGTLLVVALIPTDISKKEHVVITCQVGDGLIALIDSKGGYNDSLKIMGDPDSGDFSGETEFLTSSKNRDIDSYKRKTKVTKDTLDTVLVMSDGVADDYFPADPQIRRLYYDLIVNGIIPSESAVKSLDSFSSEDMRLFKQIPSPVAYPWVNDKSIKVPLQYTKKICEKINLSLEDIWSDRTVLDLAAIELKNMADLSDPSERLKVWLDNYVERGSFDDRTLVIATVDGDSDGTNR